VLRASLAAVDAGAAVSRVVARVGDRLAICGSPLAENRRLWVLAAGKAAAAMAAAFEASAGDRIADGLAITKDGHGVPLTRIALREAGHPVPDARSEDAAREALALVGSAGRDDALVVLLSGGASSLLACPAPGLSLADIAATTSVLLSAGAGIEELNAVRKHLSAVAGGRLGLCSVSARIEVLAISDVPGDRIDVIGSGPFAPDPTTFADALEALDRRGVRTRVPVRVAEHLAAGVRGDAEETPKPGDAGLARVRTTLLATNATAVAAAAVEASRLGMRPVVVSGSLEGEARDVGRRLAALAAAIRPVSGDTSPLCGDGARSGPRWPQSRARPGRSSGARRSPRDRDPRRWHGRERRPHGRGGCLRRRRHRGTRPFPPPRRRRRPRRERLLHLLRGRGGAARHRAHPDERDGFGPAPRRSPRRSPGVNSLVPNASKTL
jgi:glycerate-2-kinase